MSTDITPIPSIITFGSGNIGQYSLILIIGISLILLIKRMHKSRVRIILTFVALEFILGIATQQPMYSVVLIIITLLIYNVLETNHFTFDDYAKTYASFTDIIVVITAIIFILSIFYYEQLNHYPLRFSDESVLRKSDEYGNLYVRSIFYVNFLTNGNPVFPLVGERILPCGISSEPHVFNALILIGLFLRVYAKKRWSIFITMSYFISIIMTISYSNIMAITLSIMLLIFLVAIHKGVLKKVKNLIFLLVFIILFLVLRNADQLVREILSVYFYNLDLRYDRSWMQTFTSVQRLCSFSLNHGIVTNRPSIINDFNSQPVFFLNALIYFIILYSYGLKNIKNLVYNKDYLLILCLGYCIFYSFKTTGTVLFVPFILLTVIFIDRRKKSVRAKYHFNAC